MLSRGHLKNIDATANLFVGGHQNQLVIGALGDEQPIKRVGMSPIERAGQFRVFAHDGQ
jgi:hypothetical protein